jgi:restriction system protein
MALWLVRGGRDGDHEARFLSDGRIYLTWVGLENRDLSGAKDYEDVKKIVFETYPAEGKNKLQNHSGQIWAFAIPMKPGDLVAVPRKRKAMIAIGEITTPYVYDPKGEPLYRHYRAVKWLNTDVPRSAFGQDLLYSLGAFMTVCQVSKNNAEQRVRALAHGATGLESFDVATRATPTDSAEDESIKDLGQLGRDQIAQLITRRFKGHEMTRLVDAILVSQGYATYVSPPGPDRGVDILAAPAPLGFGRPRICVQVKSQDSPVDSPTLHQLVGSMQNVQADQGLLVAWGGWKTSVDREIPNQFFRVRLWDQDDLIDQLLDAYDRLPADLRTEIPLKRVWTIAAPEEEE